jgi:hypothetical protein
MSRLLGLGVALTVVGVIGGCVCGVTPLASGVTSTTGTTAASSTSPTTVLARSIRQPSQLHLASDPEGWNANLAASGQFVETFTFTNSSSTDCNLGG